MQYRILIALIAPLVLTGCLAQSKIQGKYMDSQEGCRNETARSVGGGETTRPVSESQTSPIAQRFSDCMTKEGWHLTTPKPTAVAVNNPPTGSPSTNPHAALKATPSNYPPASAYPAASSYPPNTNYPYASAYPTYPPSGAPSVNPSAAAATAPAPVASAAAPVAAAPEAAATAPAKAAATQTEIPTSPDVATYQPGRPSGQATPYYGTGPGRQF